MSTLPPSGKPSYAKPWLDFADQVAKLESHGLVVPDPTAAREFLSHVNYYRFSGYCLAFKNTAQAFFPGTSFEHVREAYAFDVTLRDLLNEALEVIEIDVRACVAHHFGQSYGAFGHVHAANFHAADRHPELLAAFHEEIERSKELFTEHFRTTYAEYPDLPVWMLTEIVSFGTLTRMVGSMFRRDQTTIADRYSLPAEKLQSILLHLKYVRNLCAHHARVWDRQWSLKAALPRELEWRPPQMPNNERLFSTLCLTYHLLKRCPTSHDFAVAWKQRLHSLLVAPPATPRASACMGLTANWSQHPVWK